MTHITIEQAELEQVLIALKRCYDVTDYPANGNTLQDEAIAVLEQALAPTHPPQRTEQEPVELPCCGYTDASAVKWNPFNGVVQCHNCGQCYTTPPQRTEPVSDDIASIIACRDMLDAQPVPPRRTEGKT